VEDYNNLTQQEWLTLAQVAQGADLGIEATQNLIGTFNEFLSGRNFGDIIKYPPQTVEFFQIIREFQHQDHRLQEIKLMVRDTLSSPPKPSHLWEETIKEISLMGDKQRELFHHLQSCFHWMTDLLFDMKFVMEKMLASEEENRNLKRKIRSIAEAASKI